MDDITIRSALDEVAHRLEQLKKKLPELVGKRIVIYGTGLNTRRVLDCVEDLTILGLMDEKHTGKYKYGKKVLAHEEIQMLGADTILIAAEPDSAEAIYRRILPFCMENHLAVVDMYGCDEIQLHKNILEQELRYPALSEEALQKNLDGREALIVPFQQVLCEKIVTEEKKLFANIEKQMEAEGIHVPNFIRNRIAAQKRIPYGAGRNLRETYHVLSTMIVVDDLQMEKIKEIEERVILENLRPRIKMLRLLACAVKQGKDVYLYSDLFDGERVIDQILAPFDLSRCKKILTDEKTLPGLLVRMLWALEERYGCDKILFLEDAASPRLILPQLYQVDFQMIQSSYDLFLKSTGLQVNRQLMEGHPDRDIMMEKILQIYDSPFLQETDCEAADCQIAEYMESWEEDWERDPELRPWPAEPWDRIKDRRKLIFPKTQQPLVSIVIPVSDRADYPDTYHCLRSVLYNTDYVPYEVIVADHSRNADMGDAACPAGIKEAVSGILVIRQKDTGYLKSCNLAAQEAKGNYVVFLHHAVQVQLNWLYPLVQCMERRKAGLAGGKLIGPDGRLWEAGGIVWNRGQAQRYGSGKNPGLPDYTYLREVDFISGGILMAPKGLWEETGGFEESYSSIAYACADLAFSLRKRGKSVLYQPECIGVYGKDSPDNKEEETESREKERAVFLKRWERELTEQYPEGKHILAACERKQKRKTVLFVSERIPAYDKDAGSRTLDFYIQEFLSRGYLVKFIPDNFTAEEPYTHRLEQMGVEVLAGKHYQKAVMHWLYRHHRDIEFAFLNYPNASMKYIDVLRKLGISVRYYGVDLHYLRLRREYELLGNAYLEEEAMSFYEKEAWLIAHSDVVYYPSLVETQIVEKEFHQTNVRQLMINIYDSSRIENRYVPKERSGVMFVGGYRHAPNVDAVLWFGTHIFPEIYQKLKIPFYIIGGDMPANIRGMDVEGTEKIGALTDRELEKMYRSVRMIVVPLRYGAGIKGKVIEAMYQGVPVVTTTIGMEGIPNEGGAVAIADDERSFADRVIALYQEEETLKQMSFKGQEIIKKYYSRDAAWEKIGRDFQ